MGYYKDEPVCNLTEAELLQEIARSRGLSLVDVLHKWPDICDFSDKDELINIIEHKFEQYTDI